MALEKRVTQTPVVVRREGLQHEGRYRDTQLTNASPNTKTTQEFSSWFLQLQRTLCLRTLGERKVSPQLNDRKHLHWITKACTESFCVNEACRRVYRTIANGLTSACCTPSKEAQSSQIWQHGVGKCEAQYALRDETRGLTTRGATTATYSDTWPTNEAPSTKTQLENTLRDFNNWHAHQNPAFVHEGNQHINSPCLDEAASFRRAQRSRWNQRQQSTYKNVNNTLDIVSGKKTPAHPAKQHKNTKHNSLPILTHTTTQTICSKDKNEKEENTFLHTHTLLLHTNTGNSNSLVCCKYFVWMNKINFWSISWSQYSQ